jgi:hypothetical protein
MAAMLFGLGISACWFLAAYGAHKAMGPIPGEEELKRHGKVGRGRVA